MKVINRAVGVAAALVLGTTALASAATAAEPVSGYPGCVPTEGQAYVAPTYAAEYEYVEHVPATEPVGEEYIANPDYQPKVDPVGTEYIDVQVKNPNYQPPWDETVVVSTTYKKYVGLWPFGTWKVQDFPPNANPQGWEKVKDNTEVKHHDAVGPEFITESQKNPNYVPGKDAVGEPTIKNPDYQPGTEAYDELSWHPEGWKAPSDAFTPTGNVRSGEGITEMTDPGQEYIEANTCETKSMSWVLPDGGTPDNVTWPQTLFTGLCTEEPATIQKDEYLYGTADQKAITDALDDDGLLTQGEDSSVYLTHTWGQTEVCEEEPPTEEPPVVTPPVVAPPTVVTPIVPAVIAPPALATPATDTPAVPVVTEKAQEQNLATTGPNDALPLLVIGGSLLAAGALFLAAKRVGRA